MVDPTERYSRVNSSIVGRSGIAIGDRDGMTDCTREVTKRRDDVRAGSLEQVGLLLANEPDEADPVRARDVCVAPRIADEEDLVTARSPPR